MATTPRVRNPDRENLKPCPFDRGGAYMAEIMGTKFPFAVRCKTCGASTAWVKSKALAITKWNWRAR